MSEEKQEVVAEISIIPLGKSEKNSIQTSISKEISIAIDAISRIKEIKYKIGAMGTEMESDDIKDILKAAEVSHEALKNYGIKRIISTIRIDQRFDEVETLEDRLDSIRKKLNKQEV